MAVPHLYVVDVGTFYIERGSVHLNDHLLRAPFSRHMGIGRANDGEEYLLTGGILFVQQSFPYFNGNRIIIPHIDATAGISRDHGRLAYSRDSGIYIHGSESGRLTSLVDREGTILRQVKNPGETIDIPFCGGEKPEEPEGKILLLGGKEGEKTLEKMFAMYSYYLNIHPFQS